MSNIRHASFDWSNGLVLMVVQLPPEAIAGFKEVVNRAKPLPKDTPERPKNVRLNLSLELAVELLDPDNAEKPVQEFGPEYFVPEVPEELWAWKPVKLHLPPAPRLILPGG